MSWANCLNSHTGPIKAKGTEGSTSLQGLLKCQGQTFHASGVTEKIFPQSINTANNGESFYGPQVANLSNYFYILMVTFIK